MQLNCTIKVMHNAMRTFVLRLALALVLGLSATLAITWAAAVYYTDFAGNDALAIVEPGLGGWAHQDVGFTRVQVLDQEFMIQSSAEALQLSQASIIAPAVSVAAQRRADQDVASSAAEHVVAFGWPWRCMWYHARAEDLHGLQLADDDPAITWSLPTSSAERTVVLPLRPLSFGLLGNAAVFSLAAFALLSYPAARRFTRRQQHCCESCGYHLRGLRSKQCPECGHAAGPQPALA